MEAPALRIPAVVLVALFVVPATAVGQAASATGPVSRADVAVFIGSFNTKHPGADRYDQWSQAVSGGLSGGFYWTDNLKTEVEVVSAGGGDAAYVEDARIPGVPFARIYSHHHFANVVASVGQAYQFGRNAWFHPFVAAGIDVDRQHDRGERDAQSIALGVGPSPRPIVIPPLTTTKTEVRVRPYASTGFKAYFNERAFFRTDIRFSARDGLEQVVWRLGIGIDF